MNHQLPGNQKADPIIHTDLDTSIEEVQLGSRELREFLHELGNLIDGSMRSAELARRDLEDESPSFPGIHDAHRHLAAAIMGLGHVAGLVRSITGQLQGLNRLAHSRLLDEPRPLRQAIEHAIDLLEPLAKDRAVRFDLELDPSIDKISRTRIYPVIANALRNAIDAINSGGAVGVSARVDPGSGEWPEVCIEIIDDGPGPPTDIDSSRVFDFGYSTKPGSSGIGLALARDILHELGGSIELRARWPERDDRRGAILVIRYPWRPTSVIGSGAIE